MKSILRQFADTVGHKFSSTVTGEPEDQIRAPFETLLQSAGKSFGLTVVSIGETTLADKLGRPDYGITVGGILCGHVELKAPGKGSDPLKFKGHDKRQWERFRGLPNLLYSDGIEWALFRSGVLARSSSLTGNPCTLGSKAVIDVDAEALQALLMDFLGWKPVVPSTAKQLALYLAPLCRMLKNDVLEALERGSPSMLGVARDWRNYLFPDADNEKFADSYAQTVTFALLLARTNGADTLLIDEAIESLSAKNTLLGRALQVLTDDEVQADVKASLDMLKRVIKEIPSKTMTKGRKDPWLHFYEDFLQEYDPKLRKDAGAYYTPLPVVHAQVRLVDDILRTKMGHPMGFAEGGVTTLDPAVGTGTYLLAIVEQAMPRVVEEEGPGAAKARASLLAQNLFGFEIMVGPYAVAALRMTRLLQDFGAGIPQDGVQVFLNNTLESPHEKIPELPMLYRAIGEEHRRAKRVKESVPVLVCIGNPPYDRHEKADASNRMSTGAWIRWGEAKNGKDAIFNDFIEPVKAAGKGGQLKNLYNLYAYFWRWALWKVFEQPYGRSGGIIAFITASSFIEGDAFLGMRRKMRELCDEIWIIDLGGDGRGTQQDDNVFPTIQTPVAIAIAVRYGLSRLEVPALAHYTRVVGDRSEKLASLDKIQALSDLVFVDSMTGWDEPFRPKAAVSSFATWPKLEDLMPWQHSGAQYKRGWPIAPTAELLATRWDAFVAGNDKNEMFKESRDRKITSKVQDIFDPSCKMLPLAAVDANSPLPKIELYGYRSFDRHYAMADNRLGDYLRPALWETVSNDQIFLATTFSQTVTEGPALTMTSDVPDLHYFNGRGSKDIIPLYRDKGSSLPNVHPDLLKTLTEAYGVKIGADEWVCYLYGVLAHPGYAKMFDRDLEHKTLRVPITRDLALFRKAESAGKKLIYLHSFGRRFNFDFERISGSAKCAKQVDIGIAISSFAYNGDTLTLSVGSGRFYPVSPEIWSFEVSGFNPLRSWLGYRMAKRSGKKTSPLDDIGLTEWTAELTSELLRLLWILESTLGGYPEQEQCLMDIAKGPVILADRFSLVPPAFRKPPKAVAEQEELSLHDE